MSLEAVIPSSRLGRSAQFGIEKGVTVPLATTETILDVKLNNITDNSRYLRIRVKNNGPTNPFDALSLILYVHPDGNPVTLATTALNAPTVGFPSGRLIWSSGSNLHQLAADAIAELVVDISGLSRVVLQASAGTAAVTADVEFGLS